MGFKIGTLWRAVNNNLLVFDQEKSALAKVVYANGIYYLHYLNGGSSFIIEDSINGLVSVSLPYVLTQEEMFAWEERRDSKTDQVRVVLGSDVVPRDWWHNWNLPYTGEPVGYYTCLVA